MWNEKFVQVTISVNNSTRKAAFAKGINRAVNFANVKKLINQIKLKGYRSAEVIHVLAAENALDNGDITLIDINGNEITADQAAGYYLVIDGQHRVYAVAELNGEPCDGHDSQITIPAVEIELCEGETLSDYIATINVTKTEWRIEDYVQSASNVKEHELLARYKELIRSAENPNGYPLSTLNLLFCANSKALNKSDFLRLCQGFENKSNGTKPIIPKYNLQRGNELIEIFKQAGFTDKDIAKRYLAQRYHDIRTYTGWSDDDVLTVFRTITTNDCAAMHGGKKLV